MWRLKHCHISLIRYNPWAIMMNINVLWQTHCWKHLYEFLTIVVCFLLMCTKVCFNLILRSHMCAKGSDHFMLQLCGKTLRTKSKNIGAKLCSEIQPKLHVLNLFSVFWNVPQLQQLFSTKKLPFVPQTVCDTSWWTAGQNTTMKLRGQKYRKKYSRRFSKSRNSMVQKYN